MFIFEVDFVLRTIYVCLLLQKKLHTKQNSVKQRTHLFLFMKFISEIIKEEKS